MEKGSNDKRFSKLKLIKLLDFKFMIYILESLNYNFDYILFVNLILLIDNFVR